MRYLVEAKKGILSFPRGSKEQVSKHFQAREFDCGCGTCPTTFISKALVMGLEHMRCELGAVIIVTSGYRCDYYQELLKARGYETSKKSQHPRGCAADIRCNAMTGKELATHAALSGFMAIGIGTDFIHCDTRTEKKRRWNYRGRA